MNDTFALQIHKGACHAPNERLEFVVVETGTSKVLQIIPKISTMTILEQIGVCSWIAEERKESDDVRVMQGLVHKGLSMLR